MVLSKSGPKAKEFARVFSALAVLQTARDPHGNTTTPTPVPATGVWYVSVDCDGCGLLLAYVFDAAPEWRFRPSDDPDSFAPRFGPEGSVSTLFDGDMLKKMINGGLPNYRRFEADLVSKRTPLLQKQVAQAGLRVLRPLREMVAQGVVLTGGGAKLVSRLEAHETAARQIRL